MEPCPPRVQHTQVPGCAGGSVHADGPCPARPCKAVAQHSSTSECCVPHHISDGAASEQQDPGCDGSATLSCAAASSGHAAESAALPLGAAEPCSLAQTPEECCPGWVAEEARTGAGQRQRSGGFHCHSSVCASRASARLCRRAQCTQMRPAQSGHAQQHNAVRFSGCLPAGGQIAGPLPLPDAAQAASEVTDRGQE